MFPMISQATNSAAPFAAAPLIPNAWHALGGVWRLTVRRFFAPAQLIAMLLLIGIVALPAFAIPRPGNVKQFAAQFAVGFYLALLVPIFAFLSGAAAFRDEMKPESVDYILTRSIRRPAFLLFKFLSHLACTQIAYLPVLAVIIVAAVYHQVPHALALLPWLLLGQLMAITAFSAFGFFSAVLTARYFVIGIAYAAIIEFAAGQIPTQFNRIAMTRQVKMMLQPMLAWTDPKLKPEQSVFLCITVLISISACLLVIAAAVFSRQEFAGARSNDA
jgi:ABC-2 type transport system permease protein